MTFASHDIARAADVSFRKFFLLDLCSFRKNFRACLVVKCKVYIFLLFLVFISALETLFRDFDKSKTSYRFKVSVAWLCVLLIYSRSYSYSSSLLVICVTFYLVNSRCKDALLDSY